MATVGSVVGAWALYGVGAWIRDDRMERLLARVGRWVGFTPDDVATGFRWFDRHGAKVVFFGRLDPRGALGREHPRRRRPHAVLALHRPHRRRQPALERPVDRRGQPPRRPLAPGRRVARRGEQRGDGAPWCSASAGWCSRPAAATAPPSWRWPTTRPEPALSVSRSVGEEAQLGRRRRVGLLPGRRARLRAPLPVEEVVAGHLVVRGVEVDLRLRAGHRSGRGSSAARRGPRPCGPRPWPAPGSGPATRPSADRRAGAGPRSPAARSAGASPTACRCAGASAPTGWCRARSRGPSRCAAAATARPRGCGRRAGPTTARRSPSRRPGTAGGRARPRPRASRRAARWPGGGAAPCRGRWRRRPSRRRPAPQRQAA